MLHREAAHLRERLCESFSLPFDSPLPGALFNELALACFEFQYRHNQPFAAYCNSRGRTPGRIAHWTEIPAVPTTGFKYVPLVAGSAAGAEAVFRTSGTTLGNQRRGTHYVLDLELYERALLPAFHACLLPDDASPVFLSLLPPHEQLPDSSLGYMVHVVLRELGGSGSGAYAGATGGIDEGALSGRIEQCIQQEQPVLLLGTSLSFVHWLDTLELERRRFELPAGSRLMDTGGYKGRSRTVPIAELLERYESLLGVPASHCVNEYGMTELLSQQYDGQLRDLMLRRGSGTRRKLAPPWLRTRVVDPETLEPVPAGETGLLQHFDLANLGSVIAVQTEDIGRTLEDGIELLGRVTGAPPRGCSIAMDDLLQAARSRSGEP